LRSKGSRNATSRSERWQRWPTRCVVRSGRGPNPLSPSDVTVRRHHADGGGDDEHLFALLALLGFQFAPRIPDLKSRRLYSFAKSSAYPPPCPLFGSRSTATPRATTIPPAAASRSTATRGVARIPPAATTRSTATPRAPRIPPAASRRSTATPRAAAIPQRLRLPTPLPPRDACAGGRLDRPVPRSHFKRANCYTAHCRVAITFPINGAATVGAEVESDAIARVGDTAHLHMTPVQYFDPPLNSWVIFAWGENSQLHKWKVSSTGALTYVAQSHEYAINAVREKPPGGMPGGRTPGPRDRDDGFARTLRPDTFPRETHGPNPSRSATESAFPGRPSNSLTDVAANRRRNGKTRAAVASIPIISL
jgi:hypothetical protein